MRKIVLILLIVFPTIGNTQVAEDWVRKYDGESFPSECHASAMTTDETGNVYVTGGCVSNPSVYYSATIKYSSTGESKWKAIYSAETFMEGIVVTPDGSVYVVGSITTGQDYNIILIKYDSEGNQIWVKIFGENDFSETINTDCIASDEFGNVYFTFRGRIDSIIGFVTIKCNSAGDVIWKRGNEGNPDRIIYRDGNVFIGGSSGYGLFVVKYNATGNELWHSYNFPISGYFDILRDLTIDNMGNIYAIGEANDSSNYVKLLIMKYSSEGKVLWKKLHGQDSIFTFGYSIAVDELQKIYITGTKHSHPSARKFITLGLNEAGNIDWEYEYQNKGIGYRILISGDGYLYVAGANTSNLSTIVIKLTNTGQQIWDISYSEGSTSAVNDIRVDINNNVIMGGKTKINGGFQYVTIKYSQTVGINPISSETPSGFFLHQNYPNPFNPTTRIKFDIPKASRVRLTVYDILGRQVAELVNQDLNAGVYEYEWSGAELSSGIYFYKLQAGDFVETRRMVLVK